VTKPTWFDDDHRCPACDEFVGCVDVVPQPLQGCARAVSAGDCGAMKECTWKDGYPPLEFLEDSDYVLLDGDEDGDESFFAVDGSVIEMIHGMDYKAMIGFGLLMAAVLVCALRHYTAKKEKTVYAEETTALLA